MSSSLALPVSPGGPIVRVKLRVIPPARRGEPDVELAFIGAVGKVGVVGRLVVQ